MRKQIEKIINNVRKKGDTALVYYSKKLDSVTNKAENFRIKDRQINSSVKFISKKLKTALLLAAKNIESFHKTELKKLTKSWTLTRYGLTTGQLIKPVETVGIYIAGGKYAFYPSIVLMTSIPARVAGVKKIIMVTPPKNAEQPAVLYAAKIAGVNEIYKIGGPQAIAALAFGTKTIPKVDMIVGPGSSYVTEAKRQVFPIAGIDLIAGPSELAILCDSSANPEFVACDLISQAEHSPEAKVWLFSNSDRVIRDVLRKLKESPKRCFVSKKQFVIVKKSISESIKSLNDLAPEHLQIMTKRPEDVLNKIKNAGAIFIGQYSPVALGDYFAGPSHVLPTGTTARFSSGLSVQTFLKRTSIIKCNKSTFTKFSKYISEIADAEGLLNHKKSVEIRTRNSK